MFSNEYGWKTEEILELTYREISWRIDNIQKRSRHQLKIDAALHGRELQDEDGETVTKKGNDKLLDEKQQRAQEMALEEAKKRKAK